MLKGRIHWLEFGLWLLFAWFAAEAAGLEANYNIRSDDPVTMAGICAIAAISLRAMREHDDPA